MLTYDTREYYGTGAKLYLRDDSHPGTDFGDCLSGWSDYKYFSDGNPDPRADIIVRSKDYCGFCRDACFWTMDAIAYVGFYKKYFFQSN